MSGVRFATIDAVRGFAVLGILVMNIVSMAMPVQAYVNPLHYGTQGPADLVAWAASFVVADGKMRALFTMLFGASMALIADRADGASGTPTIHYLRMAWLFAFGMIHAWGFWYGDILVAYAVSGAIGYFLVRQPPASLLIYFGVMFAGYALLEFADHAALAALRDAALAPGAPARTIAAWRGVLEANGSASPEIAREIALYRGSFADAFAARAPVTLTLQTSQLLFSLPEIQAFMALGILLLRSSFLTGGWSARAYLAVIASGYLVAMPLTATLALWLIGESFDPAAIAAADLASLMLRPFIATAHAALVILLVRSAHVPRLADTLARVGRMALSNYLASTLIGTSLFYGYGLGRFGSLSRADLLVAVVAIWAILILSSHFWLARSAQGPMERLWRWLTARSANVVAIP